MRSWSSLTGLVLSLAGHGALVLVLGWVWVGESPPVTALVIDLRDGGSAADARIASGTGGGEQRVGEAASPAPGEPAVRPGPVAPAPALSAPEAPVAPSTVTPRVAVSPPRMAVPAPSPPPAPPSPPTALAVEPEPIPMEPSSPAAPPPPRADVPRSLPAPATPGALRPFAPILEVPAAAPGPPAAAPVPRVASDSATSGTLARDGDGRMPAGPNAGDSGTRAASDSAGGARDGDAGRGRAGGGGSGALSDVSPGGPAAGSGPLALALPGTGNGAGGEYRVYYEGIRRLIRESLRYPAAARRRGLSGTVELELEVRPSGTVGTVAVVRSSSHRVLDDAALEAARTLPRMPFPPGVAPRALRVRIPVDFELR